MCSIIGQLIQKVLKEEQVSSFKIREVNDKKPEDIFRK
jgi:hypothetical protein